jgi:hypothetical protein
MDVLQPDKSPLLSALNLPTTSNMNNHQPSNSPWVSASDALCLARISKKLIDKKAAAMACIAADLEEVCQQKERFANMEAQLLALSQPAMDQGMEDCKESAALQRHFKKTSLSSTAASTSAAYFSPTRISSSSNKCSQVSSPASHYAMVSRHPPTPPNAALQFFTPNGESEEFMEEAEAISQRLALLTNILVAETINLVDDNDNDIDGHPQDFKATQDSETGPELGHDATSHSPPELINRAPVVRSPPTQSSALRPSSFAPDIVDPLPNMDGAVNITPNFFEGTDQDGTGPGPHFFTMSVIKDKRMIRVQLITALTKTLMILTNNLPNALVHCIKKTTKLLPLNSPTCSHFPTTGMQANNYMFIQNSWSLMPGIRNKPKLPAPKVGKDGRPVFNKNRGYEGPDRMTAILWITADCNVKDALTLLQMELEGDHLQLQWKPAQKKNSRN